MGENAINNLCTSICTITSKKMKSMAAFAYCSLTAELENKLKFPLHMDYLVLF